MRIACDVVDGSLLFEDADEVLHILAAVTRGWTLRPVPGDDRPPVAVVTRARQGYALREAGCPPVREPTAVGAACTLVVSLLNRMTLERPGSLFLHCGAVTMNGATLVLPGTHRAGKSTLVAALATAGHELVADDVLPLRRDDGGIVGIASGVLPRLRLPVPATVAATGSLGDSALAVAEDDRYRYLALPPEVHAPFGAARRLRAVILIDRRPGACARLSPVSPDAATRALLFSAFGLSILPDEMLSAVADLAAGLPAFRLTFDRLPDAIALLDGYSRGNEVTSRAAPVRRDDDVAAPSRRRRASAACVRKDGVVRSERNGAAFLVDPESGRIFALDGIGDAVWSLLDNPATAVEIAALLADAFATVDPAIIAADVDTFLDRLVRAGLVERAAGGSTAA